MNEIDPPEPPEQPEQSDPPDQSPDDVFLTAVLFESALGILALFLGWAIGPSARALVPEFNPSNVWPILTGIFYGCLAGLPILVFIELIRRIPSEAVRELERLVEDGMLKTLLKLRPGELIVISICAGIGEELLFRGWLMYWLAEGAGEGSTSTTMTMGVALAVSSIVFGLFHPVSRLYVVLASLIGIYLGGLVLYTGNLLVPIMAHATYDAAQLILTAREQRRAGTL